MANIEKERYENTSKAIELGAILDALTDPVIIYDVAGNVQKANKATINIFGFDPTGKDSATIVSRLDIRHLDGRDVNPDELPALRAIKGELVSSEQFVFTDMYEQETIIEVSAAPIFENGTIRGAIASIHDITARERALEDIRESRRQVIDILNSISDAFFALDNDWRFTYLNDKAVEILGKKKEELLYKEIWDEFPEAIGTAFYSEFHKARQTRQQVSFNELYPPFHRWFEVHAYPYENGLSVYFSDVTERRRAEESRIESERRFREILEEASLLAVLLNTEGRITFANDFLLELTGWDRDEILGQDWFDLFVPADQREDLRKGFLNSISAGTIFPHFQNDIVTKQGGRRTISFSNIILRDGEGQVIGTASIGEDITERKGAEDCS